MERRVSMLERLVVSSSERLVWDEMWEKKTINVTVVRRPWSEHVSQFGGSVSGPRWRWRTRLHHSSGGFC